MFQNTAMIYDDGEDGCPNQDDGENFDGDGGDVCDVNVIYQLGCINQCNISKLQGQISCNSCATSHSQKRRGLVCAAFTLLSNSG